VDRGQRDALLLGDLSSASGGGQPLPEALRAVLSYLYENGFTTTSVLHKIIREQDIVAFKDARILEVWKTWESFCNAILGALHDGGFISGSFGDGWMVTEKAVPGKELTVIRIQDKDKDRRTRVTFHSERERRARNEMQVVKNSVDSLITQVNRVQSKHPAYEKVGQHLLAITQLLREGLNGDAPREDEESFPGNLPPGISRRGYNGPKRREPGAIKNWVYEYLTAHPREVVSVKRLTDTFNAQDAEAIQSGEYPAIHTGVVNQAINRLYMDHPGCQVEWIREGVRHVSVIYVPPPGSEGESNGVQ